MGNAMPNATTKDWRSWRYDGARGKGSRCETAGYRMAEFIRCRPRRPDSLQVLFRSPRKVLPYLAWLTDVRPALLARGLKTDETGSVDREAVWLGFLGWTENAVRFTRVFCRAALHHPGTPKTQGLGAEFGKGLCCGVAWKWSLGQEPRWPRWRGLRGSIRELPKQL